MQLPWSTKKKLLNKKDIYMIPRLRDIKRGVGDLQKRNRASYCL